MIAFVQMFLGGMTMMYFLYIMFISKENKNQHFILYTLYLFPFMNIDIIPGIHSMSIFELSILIFSIAFYVLRRNKIHQLTYINIVFTILVVAIFMGYYFAEEVGENSINSIIQTSTILLYAKIFFDEISLEPVFIGKIHQAIKACLLFSFLFMLIQFMYGTGISISKSENINVAGGETSRYTSFFQDPQKYAQYLSMAGLMMIIPLGKNFKTAYINKFLPILAMMAIVMTGSRAALGGMIIGYTYIYTRMGKNLSLVFILIISSLIVGSVGDELPIFKRASIADSYDFRNEIWKDAIEIFKLHPVWGIGAGNYADYVRIHHPDQFWMSDNEMTFFDHPESGYLKLLIEYGTIGFTAFIALILIPLFKGFFKKNNEVSIISSASLISWLIGFYTLYSIGDIRIYIMVVVSTCILMLENTKASSTFHSPIKSKH